MHAYVIKNNGSSNNLPLSSRQALISECCLLEDGRGELMQLKHIMQPSIACTDKQLNLQSSQQTYHSPSHPH